MWEESNMSSIHRIASSYLSGNTPQDPEKMLTSELEHLGGNGYWKPPHNVVVNFSLKGANLWTFSVLPMFWQNMGYQANLGGIVIKPAWNPAGKGNTLGISQSDGHHLLTQDWATKILRSIPQVMTVSEAVKLDLRKLENHFKIEIPETIKAPLIKDALVMAKRRWGANMTKIKHRLIPLDGSRPRDLT